MPRRDGTGPMGRGSMTGRGLGNCIRFGLPLIAGAAACFGFGRGGGRGFGRQFFSANNSNDELSELKNQASVLENSLNEVKNRISELEGK